MLVSTFAVSQNLFILNIYLAEPHISCIMGDLSYPDGTRPPALRGWSCSRLDHQGSLYASELNKTKTQKSS